MKIRSVAKIASAFSLISVLGILVAMGIATFNIDKAIKKRSLNGGIVRTVNQQSLIEAKYVRQPRGEYAIEAQALHEAVIDLLQAKEFRTRNEQEILEDMREYSVEARQVFARLVELNEIHARGVINADEFKKEAEFFANRLSSLSDAIIDGAYRLESISREETEATLKLSTAFVIAATASLALVVLTIMVWLNRGLVRRLTQLNSGMQMLAQGNLEHSVSDSADDEIGLLASSFNDMAKEIRNSDKNLRKAVKEALQELSNTHMRLQAVMDAVPVGVCFSHDFTCNHIQGNRAFLDQFEASPEDNLSASAASLSTLGKRVRYFSESKEIFAKALPLQRAIAENSDIHPTEIEVVLPSGKRWFMEASGAVLRDNGGQAVGGVAVTVDVSERKRTEEKLRQNTLRLQLLSETAGRLLETEDLHTVVAQLCHTVMNYLDCQIFLHFIPDETSNGLRLAAHEGTENPPAKIEKSDLESHVCGLVAKNASRIVVNNIPSNTEAYTENFRSIGLGAYCCLPLLAQGKLLGTIGFGTRTRTHFSEEDIELTQTLASQVAIAIQRIQEREALREAKEAAERANSTKSQFLAMMSHELRTPLNAIVGFTDLLLKFDLSSEERARFSTSIERSAQLLIHLIDDILDVSKVESGRLVCEKVPVNLHEMLSDVRHIMQHKAEEKNIAFSMEMPKTLPGVIVTDPTRFKQILTNIIGNAIKFTTHGWVNVAIKDAVIDGKLYITVEDTGIGLTQEQADKLFQPFTQADASMTRKFGGTGLGLVLSRHLARALGGDLSLVRSQPGQGTSFEISLALHAVESGAGQDSGHSR